MKKWIPRILAMVVMIPILMFTSIAALVWNVVLIIDMIFRDIKRGYSKEIKTIHRNDQKRIEEEK